MIAIGLPTTRRSSIEGAQLPVELPGRLVLAGLPEPDELLHLRPDDMRVHADAADAAELEERQDQIVVAGVEVEARLHDVLRLREIVVGLLDRADVLDLGEPRDRLGLDVDHDAARDVVDDDRPVGRRRDRLEVRHDPALRRLRVVRRHDQEGVDAELVRLLGQVDRVARVVGAGAGDDGRPVAHLVERRGVELEALLVGEHGPSPVVPVTTRPSEPLSTRWRASARKLSRSTAPSRLNGVTIAVRTSPSTSESYLRPSLSTLRADGGFSVTTLVRGSANPYTPRR